MRASITVAAAAASLAAAQNCANVYGQCGGIGFSGPTCCSSGTCVANGDYYSQCIPPAGYVPGETPTLTEAPPIDQSDLVVSSPVAAAGAATFTGNPFEGVQMWANSYYASEIKTLAIPQLSPALQTAAAKVAEVPTFMWLDTMSKVPLMEQTLADIRAANKAGGSYAGQFVVYDLPERDCAAAASNGELSKANGGEAKYKEYIASIKAALTKYSDVRVVLVVEPDSLANLVTNLSTPKCAGAETLYKELTAYAISELNLANVAMYLDAGHAGWLGWPANIDPAAKLFAQIWKAAGSPSQVRGLVTNVANYNAFKFPGSTPPPYVQSSKVYDEKTYINNLAPKLAAAGFPAKFIVDQGRSGVQPTKQQEWGHWCNVVGTGFGLRPSTDTGDVLVDSIVWVKPGGECDGTSNTTATRYDWHCGLPDALQPAPEAGSWFQAYFEQLLKNANPPF